MRVETVFHRLLVNRWLAWVLAVPLLVLVILTTLQYRAIESGGANGAAGSGSMLVAGASVDKERILNDYEDFYVVGRLYREGDIIAAYDNAYLLAAQERFTGTTTFMPWAYPPPLTALVPLLPILGLAGSYLLFMLATLGFYLWALARFDGKLVGAGLLAVYPALLLDVRLGQNGLLTGALIGLTLRGLVTSRPSSGVALGCMIIKPHLAVALSLLVLLRRAWTIVAAAAVVVLASCVAATIVLGVQVWPAFVSGVHDAGGYLRQGLYPLYRMSSVYAGVRSFGARPDTAMLVHALVAIVVLGMVALAWKRKLATNRLLALTCTATVFVSPYNYDYDLACLAIALVLILPELLARIRLGELVAFYALAWLGTGWGLAQHMRAVLIDGTIAHQHGSTLNWSLQSAGLLAATILAAKVLERKPRATVVASAYRPSDDRPVRGRG